MAHSTPMLIVLVHCICRSKLPDLRGQHRSPVEVRARASALVSATSASDPVRL
jgi:hypothetical protein